LGNKARTWQDRYYFLEPRAFQPSDRLWRSRGKMAHG
jgi:hypothetical protein